MKWFYSLLSALGLTLKQPSIIWCDNLSAKALVANRVQHARSKHIEIDVHFIRDMVMTDFIEVQYVPSSQQLANSFTKALTYPSFSSFRSKLGLCSTPSSLRGSIKEI